MTQRQRKDVAYLFACGSLVASLLLWTQIVSFHVYDYKGSSQKNKVWEGVLNTAGIIAKDITQSVTQSIHTSAPDIAASVLVLPSEAIGNSELSDFSAPLKEASETDEISQWEVRNAYSLSIPSLGVRTPVLLPSMRFWENRQWNLLEEQMQIALYYGSVAYPHSVRPGDTGTLIIAGHSSPPNERAAESSFGSLFERVPELSPGDEVIVTENGERLTYIVTESIIVSPTNTDILRQQNDKSIVKLITCYPIGTTRDRMIVTAVLQE